MKKKSNEVTLGDAIRELINELRLQDGLTDVQAQEAWKKVLGNMIASRTQYVNLSGDTLFVRIDSAAIRHELSMAKSQIIDRLNEEIGAVVIGKLIIS